MNIGDYVRTIYGIKRITEIICGQDIRFDNTDGFDEDLLNYHDYDGISKNSHTWKEIVIGEPKEKIIELVEVGDYVNGCLIVEINKDPFIKGQINLWTNMIVSEGEPFLNEYYKKKIIAKDIKSIVTKEQFERCEYKL